MVHARCEHIPFNALVQGTGSAWRMEVEEFRRQIQARPALSSKLARYLHVRTLDLAQMVACTAFICSSPAWRAGS